jgi:hypothetical protein
VRTLLFICIAFVIAQGARGQDSTAKLVFSKPSILASVHMGYLVPHGAQLKGLAKRHSREVNVNLEWITNGKQDWHHVYNRPFIGLDLWASDPGNQDILGLQFSAAPYLRIPFNKNEFFSNSIKLIAGVGYMSKVWDIDSNTKAIFVGSHFNAALGVEYHIDLKVSEHIQMGTGLRFSHFSNGAFRTPNKGTNLASTFLAIRYVPSNNNRTARLKNESREVDMPTKRWRTTVFGTWGMKEIVTPFQGKYISYSLNLASTYKVGEKVSLGASLDYFYTSSILAILEDLNREGVSRKYNNRVGLAGVFNLNFDRWFMEISTGVYVHDRAKINGAIYSRYGLYYVIAEHWTLGARLKTHFAKADNFELGLGWTF